MKHPITAINLLSRFIDDTSSEWNTKAEQIGKSDVRGKESRKQQKNDKNT
jgi:hypothetical protein